MPNSRSDDGRMSEAMYAAMEACEGLGDVDTFDPDIDCVGCAADDGCFLVPGGNTEFAMFRAERTHAQQVEAQRDALRVRLQTSLQDACDLNSSKACLAALDSMTSEACAWPDCPKVECSGGTRSDGHKCTGLGTQVRL
jgi:hypothetical protein